MPPKLHFSLLTPHLPHNACARERSRLERRELGDTDTEAAPGMFSSPFAGLHFSSTEGLRIRPSRWWQRLCPCCPGCARAPGQGRKALGSL